MEKIKKRILFVFALKAEAIVFIEEFKAKKILSSKKFEVYESIDHILLISGISKLKSAIATTYCLTKFTYLNTAINIGICGDQSTKIGELINIDQIIDNDSGRRYYLDSYESNIKNKSLLCISKADTIQQYNSTVDMESSGFIEAAENFLESSEIKIYKLVSDNQNNCKICDKHEVKSMFIKKKHDLISIINSINIYSKRFIFNEDYKKTIGIINKKWKLSQTNKVKVEHIFKCMQNNKICIKKIQKQLNEIQKEKIHKRDNKKLIEDLNNYLNEAML